MKLNPSFVKTRNVRNFEVLMAGLDLAEGEGRFGLVWGQAGRGKTRTAQWYAAETRAVYLRVLAVWATSELDFLCTLARELGVLTPPRRKGPAFQAVLDKLVADPRPIILDEAEKMPSRFLELLRDLTDLSGAAIVFVGEENLVGYLDRERRVWSRVFQQLQFEPINAGDIVFYASDVAGLQLDKQAAEAIAQSSTGDFRLVRRDVIALAQICRAQKTVNVNAEMVSIAAKQTLRGN
ncbi:MAG: ATP-binding protein [Opitutae bacterium]|nr:ATP-binding protein [Opitutae bacterium]